MGPLFIIDDDGPTRVMLKKVFTKAGYETETFDLTSDLVRVCGDQVKRGKRPVLLIDLIMPRLDGHGILGGLEVMEIIAEKYADLSMLLMSEHPNAEAERKARELGGVAVLRKPKKIEIREESGVEALKNLLREVGQHLSATCDKPWSDADFSHIGQEFVADFAAKVPAADSLPEGSPGLPLLKGMLQELTHPLLGGGVILMTLRFASELLNRAVIFNVNGTEIVGIGQFGLDALTENADRMVRKLRFKVDADSLFGQVLRHKTAVKGMLSSCASDRKLSAQLGGVEPAEVFIGPLLSDGKVVSMIYADNLPELKPVGNVESFEVFLSQAGKAMKNVLLEREN